MSVPMPDSIHCQENSASAEKIGKIESFIEKLEKAKMDLMNDSDELKKEIEEAVAIQLHNLRTRELQMWRQVDALIGHQNLLIQEELSSLHFLLGSYKVASTFVEDGQNVCGLDSVDMLFNSLKLGSLQKLNFKVNHETLQSAIRGFGKLEPQCNGGAPGMLWLPAEEDYEDGDHHVLYKSVKDQQNIEGESPLLMPLSNSTFHDGKLTPTKPLSDSSGESFEILDGDEAQLHQHEINIPLLGELKECYSCHSTPDIEIENLDELSCSSNHQTLSINEWLRSPTSPNIPTVVLFAKDNASIPLVEAVCKANEKCATFSNCVCDENCMVSNLKEQMGHMNLSNGGKYSPIYLKEAVNNIIQKSCLNHPPISGLLEESKPNDLRNSLGSVSYDGWLSKDYFKSTSSACSFDGSTPSCVPKHENDIWLSDCVSHKPLSKFDDSKEVMNPWLRSHDQFKELCKPAIAVREMFLPYLKPTDTARWLIKKNKDKTCTN